MELSENFNLKDYNTFGIEAFAKYFVVLKTEKDLADLLQSAPFKENKHLFLGGGSNVLFTKDFDGIVVVNKILGKEIVSEDENFVYIKAQSGEGWHDLVLYSTEKKLWGLENLSLIPGTVGAAPMQNIGAYGSEAKETIYQVEAYDLNTGEKRVFENEECKFGYRESVFKNELKNKYFISAVIFRLNKNGSPNIEYGVLKKYIDEKNIVPKTSDDVAKIVAEIRQSKLPNPKVLGNAGSFFKNTIVSVEKFQELQKEFPEIPNFKEDNGYKIPTGWLIEQCGFKGAVFGTVGVHDRQSLVLVNHGKATGQDILDLAQKIILAVEQKFGITIVPEVNFV